MKKFATVSTTSLIRTALVQVDGNASRAYDVLAAQKYDHPNAMIAAEVIRKATKRANRQMADTLVEVTASGRVQAVAAEWGETGTDAVPFKYAIQVQHQVAL